MKFKIGVVIILIASIMLLATAFKAVGLDNAVVFVFASLLLSGVGFMVKE